MIIIKSDHWKKKNKKRRNKESLLMVEVLNLKLPTNLLTESVLDMR